MGVRFLVNLIPHPEIRFISLFMSMLVHHFVVHQIGYDNDEKLAIAPRESCLSPSIALETLCHQLNHAFNSKPGKGVGGFDAEKREFSDTLSGFIREAQQGECQQTYLSFSVNTMQRLLDAMVNTATIETGFVVFAHYEFLATQYLMIALLNTKQHIEVNGDLELSSKEHLDIAKMQLAVKIDLTQFSVQPDSNRYVSFIKGKMGRKVSDFFLHFIGCQEHVDIKEQNRKLISSVDEYLSQEQLDAEERTQHRENVREYMKEKIDHASDIQLSEVSSRLPTDLSTSRDFSRFVENMEDPIEPSFAPDPAAVRQLAKFSGQGGGVSIAFDRKLLGERVRVNLNDDTITIVGLPPNLKDQLMKALSNTSLGDEG